MKFVNKCTYTVDVTLCIGTPTMSFRDVDCADETSSGVKAALTPIRDDAADVAAREARPPAVERRPDAGPR